MFFAYRVAPYPVPNPAAISTTRRCWKSWSRSASPFA